MGNVSKHFSRWEFACSCGCGFSAVDFELLNALEEIREHFGKPIKINSACRCEQHNKKVGGADSSMHKRGMACDIVVAGVDPEQVQQYLQNKYKGSKGIGSYGNFTHFDVRENEARWIG